MKTISTEYATELIEFAPTERARKMGFAEAQLHGAVAAFNMLQRNRVAYLADEVGMGKTYIALATMNLLRFQNPRAKIVVLAPRENIQLKWIKELRNFVRNNWRVEDNRVKNLNGAPVRTPLPCGAMDEIVRTLRLSEHVDLFLRSTTFQLAVREAKRRQRYRDQLAQNVPWISSSLLSDRDPSKFRDMFGRVLNALVPPIDLLVVDEAHNFKHGFNEKVSNRNRILGMSLGHPGDEHPDCPWYGRRVKRLLLLSATPFEYDYADLHRQLDVFGFGGARLVDCDGTDPIQVDRLLDEDETLQREIVRRFLLRRVQYLNIGGQRHSKNMYRREWRAGGYERHDEPAPLTDPEQQLVVGLIQKKVAEILGDRRFNNNFQIGMLSSFESFMETLARQKQKVSAKEADEPTGEEDEQEPVFDGNQDADRLEKQGVDSHSLEEVVRSYRKQFQRSLPHPKLDTTVASLADAFETGEKALVFVRRIATVSELKVKLDERYDRSIKQHMLEMLPQLHSEIERVFNQYRDEQRRTAGQDSPPIMTDEAETRAEERAADLEDDLGGNESFFAWFFRGKGPDNLLSGAAFQRNRLANVSSAYATIFEDDHVAWLLDSQPDLLARLCELSGHDRDTLRERLRRTAYAYFQGRTNRQDGYPRLYVFEAYQFAGLRVLAAAESQLREQAQVVLQERYTTAVEADAIPPEGFPQPEQYLGAKTFFTELVRREELRQRLWPDAMHVGSFAHRFRQREQRRELLSAMTRLGAAYIDLYLLAIRRLGSFTLGAEGGQGAPADTLVADFLDLLETQMRDATVRPNFNAFYELSEAASAFEIILAVNFPEVRDARMSEFAKIFGRGLQNQEPVGKTFGGVNKRLVKQFRMPGYPLVLATTDVLQEGEDLHTFCRRVIHYGITWTPSAMEQRTGRIDRIGSLAQRNLDGSEGTPRPEHLIQVYYPHLSGTVEQLQVQTVLKRLNEFLRLIHKTAPGSAARDSRVDVSRAILNVGEVVPRIATLLESDFPVDSRWLRGQAKAADVVRPDLTELSELFVHRCEELRSRLGIDKLMTHHRHRFAGRVAIAGGRLVPWEQRCDFPHHRQQPFELELRSQLAGEATLIRCRSPIGEFDLRDDRVVDQLYDQQFKLGMVRLCAVYNMKHHRYDMSVEMDRLFHSSTTQIEELEDLVTRNVIAADSIESEMRNSDAPAEEWARRQEAEEIDG